MEAAKLAVTNFTSRTGVRTDVEEVVLPAVTWETVKPTRHEIITKAVDREVHADHYHTTVQPLSHTETIPTKHVHNMVPVKEVRSEHPDRLKKKLAHEAELALFKNTQVIEPVVRTRAELPDVVGEHIHHHVHEVVQPVIYKDTHQRETVHTTVPVHETHHNEPVHHSISQLPMKLMAEFTESGGILHQKPFTNRSEYDGDPRAFHANTAGDKFAIPSAHANNRTRQPNLSINVPPTAGTTTTSTTMSSSLQPTTKFAHTNNGLTEQTTTIHQPTTTTTAIITPKRRTHHHQHHNSTPIGTNTNNNLTHRTRRSTDASSTSSSSLSERTTSPSPPRTPRYTNTAHNTDNVIIRDDTTNLQNTPLSPTSPTSAAAAKHANPNTNTSTGGVGSLMSKFTSFRRSGDRNRTDLHNTNSTY